MLNLLTPLASLLGIEAGEIVERAKKNAGLWGTIAAFALIALVFLLVAAHAGLTMWVGPIWAPLIIAGVAALIALIAYVVGRVSAEAQRKKEMQRRKSAETAALVTTATVTAVPLLLKSPLLKTVGIPLGAALALWLVMSRRKPDDPPET
ncbi:MAG TPA: phage holin family protein [Devosia sp.]|nr:phage holin family protein [Devosia sp.]